MNAVRIRLVTDARWCEKPGSLSLFCSHCGAENFWHEPWDYCPKCGFPMKAESKKSGQVERYKRDNLP